MRQRINSGARGVLVAVVVVVLSMPVQAASIDGPDLGWVGRTRDRIERVIKAVKKTIRSFGDGLSDPRP